MRSLTTEGKVLAFKSLLISKIVYLSLIIKVTQVIINQLNVIQKTFKQLQRQWVYRRSRIW